MIYFQWRLFDCNYKHEHVSVGFFFPIFISISIPVNKMLIFYVFFFFFFFYLESPKNQAVKKITHSTIENIKKNLN